MFHFLYQNSLHFLCIYKLVVRWQLHLLQARFFFQQLISGVSYCHSAVHFALILNWNENMLHYVLTITVLMSLLIIITGNMSQGSETGKYTPGWKSNSSAQDLWFWVLQGRHYLQWWLYIFSLKLSIVFTSSIYFIYWWIAVCFIAFTTQINSWNTRIHCSRGLVKKGIWWKGKKGTLLRS